MPIKNKENRIVSVKEAAEELGVHITTIYQWIANGDLPSGTVLHIGRVFRIRLDRLIAYGEQRYGRRAKRGRQI